jgi:hypothetical protein
MESVGLALSSGPEFIYVGGYGDGFARDTRGTRHLLAGVFAEFIEGSEFRLKVHRLFSLCFRVIEAAGAFEQFQLPG